MQFEEKATSVTLPSSRSPVRKSTARVLGLRMARCALRILSSTSFLLKMGGPKGSLTAWPRGWPRASQVDLNETRHFQASVDEESRHSVGHLESMFQQMHGTVQGTDLVQVPLARGSVMPEIDSMSDDFPAL